MTEIADQHLKTNQISSTRRSQKKVNMSQINILCLLSDIVPANMNKPGSKWKGFRNYFLAHKIDQLFHANEGQGQ